MWLEGVLFFPLHFFKVFIIGPFVLCGGLFGFLKLLPMFKKKKKLTQKKFNSFSLLQEMWVQTLGVKLWKKCWREKGRGKKGGKGKWQAFLRALIRV